jgi:hypothetical protein
MTTVLLLVLTLTLPGVAAPPTRQAEVVDSPEQAAIRVWECQQAAVCVATLLRVDVQHGRIEALDLPALTFARTDRLSCPGVGLACFDLRSSKGDRP